MGIVYRYLIDRIERRKGHCISSCGYCYAMIHHDGIVSKIASLRFKVSSVRFKAGVSLRCTFDLISINSPQMCLKIKIKGISAGKIRNNVQTMPDQSISAYHGAALCSQSSALKPELHQMLIWRNTKTQRKNPENRVNS